MNQKSFDLVMGSEGGVNFKEPASAGGKSCGGISQKTYENWLKTKCKISDAPGQVEELIGAALGTEWEKRNPFTIPDEYGVRCDVIRAFYEDYFKPAALEYLPECLEYMHLDFFVNAGFTANKIVQKLIGFTGKDVDGVIIVGDRMTNSKKTLMAFTEQFNITLQSDPYADNDLIEEYHQLKLEHYESLKAKNPELYEKNIRGWRMRADHVKAELAPYFEDESPTTSAIDDNDHIDVFEHESVLETAEVEVAEVDTKPDVDIGSMTSAQLAAFAREIANEFAERARAGGN